MKTKDIIFEEAIEFVDDNIFGNDMEHTYDCECKDCVAIGTLSDPSDTSAPKKIKIEYPSLEEILEDEDACDYILQYRGLYDLTASDINYGDIMMAYGDIVEVLEK
jgi:hypothetical protein